MSVPVGAVVTHKEAVGTLFARIVAIIPLLLFVLCLAQMGSMTRAVFAMPAATEVTGECPVDVNSSNPHSKSMGRNSKPVALAAPARPGGDSVVLGVTYGKPAQGSDYTPFVTDGFVSLPGDIVDRRVRCCETWSFAKFC